MARTLKALALVVLTLALGTSCGGSDSGAKG